MRISTKVVIILLFLNGAVNVVHASGLGEDMGVTPSPGNSKALEHANESADKVNASSGFGSTLFGTYSAAAQTFQAFVHAIFAAPMMFKSLGVPAWFVDFVFKPAYIIAAIDILYAVSGRVL